MSDPVVVYAVDHRAAFARAVLPQACEALGTGVQLELFSSGALFGRLRIEQERPRADVLLGHGPYLGQLCAREDLLETYEPAGWPSSEAGNLVTHEPDWRWVAGDFLPFTLTGASPPSSFDQLDSADVPHLAVLDPRRSEIGMMASLAVMARARQLEGDPERGWEWWEARHAAGLTFFQEIPTALTSIDTGQATHLLHLGRRVDGEAGLATVHLAGLAPMPNALAVLSGAPHPEAARLLVDWLVGAEAAHAAAATGSLSRLANGSGDLSALAASAPPLDVDWTFSQYRSVRAEWKRRPYPPS